jgi:hypothetical protein
MWLFKIREKGSIQGWVFNVCVNFKALVLYSHQNYLVLTKYEVGYLQIKQKPANN